MPEKKGSAHYQALGAAPAAGLAYGLAPGFAFRDPGQGRFPAPWHNRIRPEIQRHQAMYRVADTLEDIRQKMGVPDEEWQKRVQKAYDDEVARRARIERGRQIMERQKAEMQRMIDEGLQRQKGFDYAKHLKEKMEILENAKAQARAQSAPPAPRSVSLDDPFGAAERAAGQAPIARAPLSLRSLGTGISRVGPQLAGGPIVDWLVRLMEAQRALGRPVRPQA